MSDQYLTGKFAPVLEERSDDHPLEVTGAIPPDLDGVLLRNGPNPAVPPDAGGYDWLEGDGMLHQITLGGGVARGYRNRWVRTRKLATELGTPPPTGPGEPIDGPCNSNVLRHGGTTLALCGSGFPLAVSPTLERTRIHDFDGMLASPMTAHPKVDPISGELVFFGVDPFGPPFLRSHVADRSGMLASSEEIDLPRAVLMHDFGVTATRTIFLDLPVVFDLGLAGQGRSLPYRWSPDEGARVGVLPRQGTGADIRWYSIDPAYVFHVLNAHDDGDAVVLDVVRYDAAFDSAPDGSLASSAPFLTRWTIDPSAGRVREERLDDRPVEFPRIDDTVACHPHRYGYCTLLRSGPLSPGTAGLIKYDFLRGGSECFDPGEHRSVGEPVFVRAADGRAEDEGWILSIVHDAARDASDLVILDATSFGGPPVATVHLPARVPCGFHGSWIPSTS
jgi:carotenoid cleavage dioxygenase